MSVFKHPKVSVNQLLGVIPEGLLANLSITTKVDHYSKVLHGKEDVLSFIIWDFGEREA